MRSLFILLLGVVLGGRPPDVGSQFMQERYTKYVDAVAALVSKYNKERIPGSPVLATIVGLHLQNDRKGMAMLSLCAEEIADALAEDKAYAVGRATQPSIANDAFVAELAELAVVYHDMLGSDVLSLMAQLYTAHEVESLRIITGLANAITQAKIQEYTTKKATKPKVLSCYRPVFEKPRQGPAAAVESQLPYGATDL